MEINENVLLVIKTELAAAKCELERLENLTFASDLKEARIETLRQEIQQVEERLKL